MYAVLKRTSVLNDKKVGYPMADDWIQVRGPTPTEELMFELKAKLKLIVILIIVLIALWTVFYNHNPVPGQDGSLCKQSSDCGTGFCCGGYISQTGPNAGYATCRRIGESKCFP